MTAGIEPELNTAPETLLGTGVADVVGTMLPFPGNVSVEFAGE